MTCEIENSEIIPSSFEMEWPMLLNRNSIGIFEKKKKNLVKIQIDGRQTHDKNLYQIIRMKERAFITYARLTRIFALSISFLTTKEQCKVTATTTTTTMKLFISKHNRLWENLTSKRS